MKFKVKDVNLASGGVLVAVLNTEDAKALVVKPGDRISIKRAKLNKKIIAVVDVTDKGLKKGEIGLFDETMKKLGVKHKDHVKVLLKERPASVKIIKEKLDGKKLNKEETEIIVSDIVNDALSDVELAYFVSASYIHKSDIKEAAYLTDAIVKFGDKLKFKDKIVLDKHCIGGVAGNRTTMVVIPIIASLGYKIPKTSSRAITSASGTADTMEVLAPVKFGKEKATKIVKKTNGCIIWGGAVNLAGADDKLIKVRHPLHVDPTNMLLSSIMAKKKAAGATHVLIDIPWGNGAKVTTKKEANELKNKFLSLSKLLNLKIKVVLTDGSVPIGNGIGPALECQDVLSVLEGDGPNDLREKSILLATNLLQMTGVKKAKEKVLHVLDEGIALEKLKEIIKAQGGRKNIILPKAKYFKHIHAKHYGKIKIISNPLLNKAAHRAGAPFDKAAGIYLRIDKNENIKKGETLLTIYSNSKTKLKDAVSYIKKEKPIKY